METEHYRFEYTDTFGGETNYAWVRRGQVEAKSQLAAVRKIKAMLGLSGVKCQREEWHEWLSLKPIGSCTVVIITPFYP